MTDLRITRSDVDLFARVSGAESADAPTVVFAHALGCDMRIWEPVLPFLPPELRVIRMDMRGHGASGVPAAPYSMGALISDAEAVCDALKVRDCVFVGLSIGGMIAQGLAVKRLDIMRGLVLSNTAAKIGNAPLWQDRIDKARKGGTEALAEGTMPRWFSRGFRESPEFAQWRTMFTNTPVEGYAGCAAAIAGTDFYTPTSGLRLPTLGIACSEDGSTPADLVRETVDLIPGSHFRLMRRVGHMPCVEAPEAYAALLTEFLTSIGHV